MPLPSYGVVIGTLVKFERDPPDDFGRYFHGHIFVNAGGTTYRCAVDVNTPNGDFQFMFLAGLDASMFTNISGLANGYHSLARNATSGAIDYIRSPFINRAQGCVAFVITLFNAIFKRNDQLWATDTGENVLNDLEALVNKSERIYVFGAPFTDGSPGLHDIHYNQGDPPGPHFATNGIWQDGCVIIKAEDTDLLYAYLGKFKTQSLKTDNNGNPI
ncbi:MAG: DUF2278 family protein [Ferruginibacter sp.]